MRSRTLIGIAAIAAVLLASHENDLAAIYVAIAWGGLAYHLHAIEVKVNKLLDHERITVWDSDIAKE